MLNALIDCIDSSTLIRMMDNVLLVMEANEGYLTDLDAEIGDADHGVNMVRGFRLVHDRLHALSDPGVEEVLNTVGMAVIEGVAGSSGVLYGMFFTQGGASLQGRKVIDKSALASFFSSGYSAIVDVSGGTRPGEKTMIDALDPAVKSLNESAGDVSATLTVALERAVEAARGGLERTIDLVATKGRAAYLGERSRGHQDIGATTMYLIIRTMCDTLEGGVGVKIVKHAMNGAILEEANL
jgi:phosphoenolpyruvate---glycerone phosphotransferase subunit DhaL